MKMSEPASPKEKGIANPIENQNADGGGNQRSSPSNEPHQALSDETNEQGDEDLNLSDEEDQQEDDYHKIKHHPSYEQVMLDVNRCAGRLEHIRQCYFHRTDDEESLEDLTEEFVLHKNLPHSEGQDESRENNKQILANSERLRRLTKDLQYQKRLKKKLAKLIVRLLIRKHDLHYYQGFHDVCLTFMTLYGETVALEKLDALIDSHFSDFMQPTMNETQEFLALIPILIGLQDAKLQDFLERAEVGNIFALSWVITWFSHVIPNECDVETIFSTLQATDDPYLVLYLCAEIVLSKKEQLLQMEPEVSVVHHYLCRVPRKEKLPVKELLAQAKKAYEKWPPEIVKEKLSQHRNGIHMQNYNPIRSIADYFYPTITSLVSSPTSRRAVFVFIVASALALQFDRWIR